MNLLDEDSSRQIPAASTHQITTASDVFKARADSLVFRKMCPPLECLGKEARLCVHLKRTFALAGMLALLQYLVVYYSSFQFHEFVQQEADRAPAQNQLQQALPIKAKEYALPVTEKDISITTTGGVLRVAVDYTVPVNLLVYRPALKFHAIGSGIVRQLC